MSQESQRKPRYLAIDGGGTKTAFLLTDENGHEVKSITLGATNPNGGTAKISCMILALLSLQFLSSGFNMMHFDSYFKEFTWGLLLIIVLSINFFTSYFRQKRGQHKA